MSRFVLTAQLQLQAPNNVGQVVQQIQRQLNGVQVNVQVQGTQQAQRQVQALAQSCNAASNASERLGSTFAGAIRRFSALAIATRAVSLFTNTLSKAVEESIDFERQLIKISQVTGKSVQQLSFLTKTIKNLSTGLGVSSSSLLNVSQILSQAGFSARETEIALRSLAKTELAPTFDDITQTAEGAVAIFNQFRAGAEALESQLGSINAVAGKFAVEAGDLISVIRRTGGVFKASGGDLNELIALFTSVRATTRESAESIATGLRTIFTRIQRPKTIEFLKEFGVQLTDLDGKFVGPFEAVRRLSSALAGLEQGDITFIRIAEELGGFRQIGKVIPLLQQFSVAQQALNVAQEGSSSLAKDAASAQAALAVQITKVKEEFLSLVRGVTETTTFQLMAKTVLNLASSFIKVADALKPILPLITAIAAVRFTQGIGGFLGGLAGGLGGRRFATGGKVHAFARGGMVPGSGNRDTVPAMLTPGEFVIKKSSVAKLGAGTLAQMNENRYMNGTPKTGARNRQGMTPEQVAAAEERKRMRNSQKGIESRGSLGNFGLAAMYGTSDADFVPTPLPDSEYSVNTQFGVLDKTISDKYEVKMRAAVKKISTNFAKTLAGDLKDTTPIAGAELNKLMDRAGFANAAGAFFETALALTGAPYEQKSTINDSMDFVGGLGDAAKNFGLSPTIMTDATRTAGSGGKGRSKFAAQIKRFLARDQSISSLPGFETSKKFATGGSVGTDTVPALLTPGEFVINKASAQRIGYGSLNRMNKVGKYAKGGTVQRFAGGGAAQGGGNIFGGFDQTTAALLGLNTALAVLAPSVDETSSTFSKMIAGGIQAAQEVTNLALSFSTLSALMKTEIGGKILGSFKNFSQGLQSIRTPQKLNPFANIGGSLGQKAKSTAISQAGSTFAGKIGQSFGKLPVIGRLFAALPGVIQPIIGVLSAWAGPILAVVAGFKILSGVISGFRDLENRLNEAVKAQDTLKAQSLAVSKSLEDSIGGLGAGIVSLFGTGAEETVTNFLSYFGGQSVSAIKSDIDARIQSAKAAQDLAKAQDVANNAMKELESGTITASEALAKVQAATSSVETATQAQNKAITAASGDKSTGGFGIARNILSLGGLLAESAGTRNERIQKENEQRQQVVLDQQKQQFETQKPLALAAARSTFARGGTIAQAEEASGATQLRQRQEALLASAAGAAASGDDGTARLFREQAELAGNQAKQLEDSLAILQKEVQRSAAQFKAFNLGLNTVSGAANATITSLENYKNSQEAGNIAITSSFNTLQASVTSAAAGISNADFGTALQNVSDVFDSFGATNPQIQKFKSNIQAVYTAQKNSTTGLKQFSQELQNRQKQGLGTPTGGDQLDQLLEILIPPGASKELQDGLRAAIESAGSGIYDEIAQGNFGSINEILSKVGQDQLKQAEALIKAEEAYQKAVVDAAKNRWAAENSLTEATKKRLSVELEAAQIIADAGGPSVTASQKRANVLAQANQTGLSTTPLQTGSAQELQQRSAEINRGLARIQSIRQQAAATGGTQLSGEAGAKLAEEEKRLQDANKNLYDTTKSLIDIKKEEVKLIQEKNRLEKSSFESLLAGDTGKFLETQATLGAVQSISSGGNLESFDADTLNKAFEELKRQFESGVREIGGRQLGGSGGLLEQAARATAQARGFDPGQAAFIAQKVTGETPEESKANAEIRELAATLPNFAKTEEMAAQMQLQAAKLQYEVAVASKPTAVMEAGLRSRGGPIYASRGTLVNFKPKGTDTVPAMLTPGEFVVNRNAVNRGNNLQILQSMNSNSQSFARGGKVKYFQFGGLNDKRSRVADTANNTSGVSNIGGFDSAALSKFSSALESFNNTIKDSIAQLQQTKFTVQLAPTDINVNINGLSSVSTITNSIKEELLRIVSRKINSLKIDTQGNIVSTDREIA